MRSARYAARTRGVPAIVCLLGLGFAIGGCGDAPITETVEPLDSVVAAASIEMGPEPQLFVDRLGAVLQANAAAYAKDGSPLGGSVTHPERFSWSSSAPGIATVDQRGSITSVGWGTATITATQGSASGGVRVVVKDAVRLAWSLATAKEARAGIAIGADGTIYVPSRDRLSAVSRQGNVLWTQDTASTIGIPAIGDDGTLYLGDLDGVLTAVRPDGTVRWQREVSRRSISCSLALGPDGTIYAASEDSLVYAVDPRGVVKWAYKGTDRFFRSSPAIASDGTIYVGASDGTLNAVNPDGSARWKFKADGQIHSSPSIGMDGTIYFSAFDTRVYAVKPDGTQRWRTVPLVRSAGDSFLYASPTIGSDGTVYVAATGLVAIDPNGSVRWNSETGGRIQTDPVLGADGTVYAGGPNGVIYAFDAQGVLKWTYSVPRPYPVGMILGSPAIGVDGTIYAASDDGTLWAFAETESKNGGYAGSPWPKARGDRANVGRAGVR